MVDSFLLKGTLDSVGSGIEQQKTPDLCEIWTWQGDTSILPFKFESVLNAAATEPGHLGFGKEVFSH